MSRFDDFKKNQRACRGDFVGFCGHFLAAPVVTVTTAEEDPVASTSAADDSAVRGTHFYRGDVMQLYVFSTAAHSFSL